MSGSRYGYAALARLAWPVVLSRSAQAVIGFSDALMTASLAFPRRLCCKFQRAASAALGSFQTRLDFPPISSY